MIIDYTKYHPGNAVSSAGLIVVCPVCSRNGEERPGTKRYQARVVHGAETYYRETWRDDRYGHRVKRNVRSLKYTDRCNVPLGTEVKR